MATVDIGDTIVEVKIVAEQYCLATAGPILSPTVFSSCFLRGTFQHIVQVRGTFCELVPSDRTQACQSEVLKGLE